MNASIHLAIGSVVILFFLFSFLIQHHTYQLLFAILTAYTFLIYLDFASSQAVQQKLGIGALAILIATLISMFVSRHQDAKHLRKREQAEQATHPPH